LFLKLLTKKKDWRITLTLMKEKLGQAQIEASISAAIGNESPYLAKILSHFPEASKKFIALENEANAHANDGKTGLRWFFDRGGHDDHIVGRNVSIAGEVDEAYRAYMMTTIITWLRMGPVLGHDGEALSYIANRSNRSGEVWKVAKKVLDVSDKEVAVLEQYSSIINSKASYQSEASRHQTQAGYARQNLSLLNFDEDSEYRAASFMNNMADGDRRAAKDLIENFRQQNYYRR
jgi:hypothetical protein